ncbi:MAG: prepilin-type N-terminal cleavage/methylation domain-containing protein [Fimbriimonadaceae bacterium]|nr:prepilin-type N-terminal cleavage/methylation domain-containing protein [Fimbriimonadaceae bacterium]
MRRRAFTLVELLIVIAIIAILSGIIYSAYGRATDDANKAKSLSQLHQLSQAILMYTGEHDDRLPMSTNYDAPATSPDTLWSPGVHVYAKSEELFVAPGSNGKFAGDWDGRGEQTIGLNSATAYASGGCDASVKDPTSCLAFTTVLSRSDLEEAGKTAILTTTPGGAAAQRYRGFEFSPYTGIPYLENPTLSPPLVADRDLVQEQASLPAELLKPVFCRYGRNGRDAGMAPIAFLEGNVKHYSAVQIMARHNGTIWRLR